MSKNTANVQSPYLCDRATTACFSGHRPEKLPFNINFQSVEEGYNSYICLHIHEAYLNGYRTFLTGMARGFDILAAYAVIKYRERFNVTEKISLVGVSPYSEEIDRLNGQDLYNYNLVKHHCDEMIYLNREYVPWCYHQRNRFMVDNSSLLICSCLDENSGTGSTIRYARKKGLTVDNINPNNLIIPSNEDMDYLFSQKGFWVLDSGKKGTVTRCELPSPFNDTSENQKKQ